MFSVKLINIEETYGARGVTEGNVYDVVNIKDDVYRIKCDDGDYRWVYQDAFLKI
ncbi:MAG: hypothetical protein ACRCZ9_07185 [Fusobacteriaceae bacterium]